MVFRFDFKIRLMENITSTTTNIITYNFILGQSASVFINIIQENCLDDNTTIKFTPFTHFNVANRFPTSFCSNYQDYSY